MADRPEGSKEFDKFAMLVDKVVTSNKKSPPSRKEVEGAYKKNSSPKEGTR